MLRLVHPAKQGKEIRPSKGRHSFALSLQPEETARLRAAIRHLAFAYGGYDVLGEVVGMRPDCLQQIVYRRSRGSYAVAVIVARAAGIPLEQLLRPGVSEVGKCAWCGRKGAR